MRNIIFFFLLIRSGIIFSQEVLSLNDAVSFGLKNRFDILLTRNQQKILDVNNNYGNAGFYPVISAQGGQNYTVNSTRQEFFSGDIREGTGVNSNALSASVALDWRIFDGKNMFIQKDRLEKEASRGLEAYKIQVENAVLDIRLAYLTIQENMDRIKTIDEAIKLSVERKELMTTRYNIGSVSGQALLQVQVDMNADSLQLEQAKMDLKNAKIRLNQSINRAPDVDFAIETLPLETGLYTYEEMAAQMLSKNKNLNLVRLNEELADLNIKSVNTQKLPSVNLGAAYNYNRSEAEIGIFKFNRNSGFTYGLTAQWNLFNGFRVRNQAQTARLMSENTKLGREQLETDLKTNLYMVMEQMNMLQNIVRLTEDNIRVAEENVKISFDRLNIGSLTPIELRAAQIDLINVSFQQILQKYQLKRLEWNVLWLAGMMQE
ncbi:MAG: TolC family protein [Saprospiraceae bacterium]|nr:TolC family protein [Saprospiraceae bacterium]MBK7523789.1 TolC family protein [Saprospiraceae bacterium]MBK8371287.1 TolC family protein [Saprospiraceae bacterium]MBK8545856.1 TolC family protein [Saprospiraceae bacterium]MBK8853848.1 TolC family protein [Saprospiraceae bacterium]